MHLLEGSAQFYTLILQSRLVCHLLGFRGLAAGKPRWARRDLFNLEKTLGSPTTKVYFESSKVEDFLGSSSY